MNLDTNESGHGGELGTKCIRTIIGTICTSMHFGGWKKQRNIGWKHGNQCKICHEFTTHA